MEGGTVYLGGSHVVAVSWRQYCLGGSVMSNGGI